MIRSAVVTGQSSRYHDWTASSPTLAAELRSTGLFDVSVLTSPPAGASMQTFAPRFADFDLLVLDYEGDRWPDATERALVDFVHEGGGLVVVHATDNAFPDWPAFQNLCGIGGWGGRDETAGPKVRWRNGRQVLDTSPGLAIHPPRQDFLVEARVPDHPILEGLPPVWLHADDELYSQLRGPARNLTVLATARIDADAHPKATGEHEPVLMTIGFGRGRVFHTTLGHVGVADDRGTVAIDCVGFTTTFQRGSEWAACDRVTQPTPPDFPTAYRTAIRRR